MGGGATCIRLDPVIDAIHPGVLLALLPREMGLGLGPRSATSHLIALLIVRFGLRGVVARASCGQCLQFGSGSGKEWGEAWEEFTPSSALPHLPRTPGSPPQPYPSPSPSPSRDTPPRTPSSALPRLHLIPGSAP
jgi:hypothetical protein